jgi:hypothetical protein
MNLIVVAFWACLAHAPDQCERVELPIEGRLQACMLAAQPAIAAWLNENPRRVLRIDDSHPIRCDSGQRA